MNLKSVVPWGRSLNEYKAMFKLSDSDLSRDILGCGDGPASFNIEASKFNGKIVSVDPIYQFSADEIEDRVAETSSVIANELHKNREKFVWKNFNSVDEVVESRLNSMKLFLSDFRENPNRYIYGELPNLEFQDNSFDTVLSSHFLFLYSQHFDFKFHIDSILEMCRVSRKDVRIFPVIDLNGEISPYLNPVIEVLKERGYRVSLLKTEYEFQRGGDQMLKIEV